MNPYDDSHLNRLARMFALLSHPLPAPQLAMDKRVIDQDGHLSVSSSVISAESASPYLGSEIPDYRQLGLDPNTIYQLYRPGAELAKSAPSFAGKPLLSRHQPLTAAAHDDAVDLVVGAVADPVWDPAAGVLRAGLTVWDGPTIRRIQSGEQADLSAAYRYRAVMQPGTFNGTRYDGKMVDLIGNHVAVIPDGRVEGAIVGDQAMVDDPEIDARDDPRTRLLKFLQEKLDPDDLNTVTEIVGELSPNETSAFGQDSARRRGSDARAFMTTAIAAANARADADLRKRFPTMGHVRVR